MDVNAPIDGRSPLHLAADYGQLEVMQYLVMRALYGTLSLAL